MKTFKYYIKNKATELKVPYLEKYKLKSTPQNKKINHLELDFGHFETFKVHKDEIKSYCNYNRIFDAYSLKNNITDLYLFFKEFSLKSHPVLKDTEYKIKQKPFKQIIKSVKVIHKSLLQKKLLKGKIIKEIKGGFIVSIAGFKAFLPNSQHCIQKDTNNLNSKLFFKPILVKVLSVKIVKSTFNTSNTFNYFLNIIISSKKPMKNFKRKSKKMNIKKIKISSKLLSIKQFKFPN